MKGWDPRKAKLEADHGEELRKHMRALGWLVEKIHGSLYLKGWPDYYCYHPRFGERWVEMKRPTHGHLHESQLKQFTKMQCFGVKITIAETVADYDLVLAKENNWWRYSGSREWKPIKPR